MGRKKNQGKKITKGSNVLGRALVKKNQTQKRLKVANPNTDTVQRSDLAIIHCFFIYSFILPKITARMSVSSL
jgi:hypothetical protein